MEKSNFIIAPSKLIVLQLYFNIIVKFLINDLHMPRSLNYISDMITIIMFLFLLGRKKVKTIFLPILFLLYIAFGVLSAIINNVDAILVIWALRNIGRFFIWFMVTIEFLDKQELEKLFRVFNYFLIVNLAFMLFQYTILGLRDDYLNGFFGSYTGGNSAINTFFVIMTIENIAAYLSGKRKFKRVFFNIILMVLMSAINELKFYFVELIIILIFALWFSLNKVISIKTLTKVFFACLLILIMAFVGYKVLIHFYPGFANFFDSDIFVNYITRSYNSSGIVYVNEIRVANRFSAYGIIMENFLITPFTKFFGIGMGAAEYTNFFRGEFHLKYGEAALTGYAFPHILLENGFCGVILFSLMLITIGLSCKWRLKNIYKHGYILILSGVVAFAGIFLCIYNSALRIESSGYLFYTVLALGINKKMVKQYDH